MKKEKQVSEAQEKIEAALNNQFDRLKADMSEDEALEEILGNYGRLSQMADGVETGRIYEKVLFR